ncbi:MAG: choice-of-anchor D domain-containing protein, partial [Calditrichaeota bacterium]|nr:choice-of-anchor D domain-containing protein [Calditrichota bacterium]
NTPGHIWQIEVDENWNAVQLVQDFAWNGNQEWDGIGHDGDNLWLGGWNQSEYLIFDDGLEELHWLSILSSRGVLDPDNDEDIALYLKATDLIPGIYEAELHIQSNDPGSSDMTVEVTLNIPEPDIAVEPAQLNFGELGLGQSAERTFTISNNGDGDLNILNIQIVGQYFDIQFNEQFIIEPFSDSIMTVTFSPQEAGDLAGRITIQSNDPDEESIFVDLTGVGRDDNNPPDVMSPIDDIELDEDFEPFTLIDLTEVFVDQDDDELTFSAESDNENFIVEIVDGSSLRLDSAPNWNGNAEVTVTAGDRDEFRDDGPQRQLRSTGNVSGWTPRRDLTTDTNFNVTVNPVNDPPVLVEIGNLEVDENQELSFQLEANDPDVNDNLTFETENLPEGATLNGDAFSWTPNQDQSGFYGGIIFRVWDNGNPQMMDEEMISITVNNVNLRPVLTVIGNQQVNESEELIFQLEASDPDNNNLFFEGENLPNGALLTGNQFNWTPDYDQAGIYDDVIIRVYDDGDPSRSDEETITITVNNTNRAPLLSVIGNKQGEENQELTFQLQASDPDDDNLTFETENLPNGATLNGNRFSWTPDYDQAGVYNDIVFRVLDDSNPQLSDEETIVITIDDVNRPPVLSEIGDQTVDENEELTFTLEANDPDGDNISFEATNLPEGATLEGDSFSWTPDNDQSGVYETIIFRALDDGEPQMSDEEVISITVGYVNHAPLLAEIGNQQVNENEELTFQLEASDQNDDNLYFEAENLPEGATLDGDRFSWTPDFDQAGVYEGIVFRVWDDGNPIRSDDEIITITVINVNSPPELSEIGDQQVVAESNLSFQLQASDPQGDNLTFEAENLPEGARLIDDQFSWTPDFDQSGVHEGIVFRVWDDGNPRMSDEETITITVIEPNYPPVLSQIGDLDLIEGVEFTLQLDADDPNEDNLTFEADNLPVGATLNG